MDRVILHCDMNSFFASVELLEHPELRSKPVAVCGDPDSRHGIILAKNEAAKKYGIKTAETIWQARKKCPGLVLLPPHMNKYKHYSQELNKIYQRYTDLVEPFSIDESWMDVTASLNLFGSGRQIADEIRQTVKKELGLTLSAGVSFNKIFAKMGSEYKKPDATTEITRENYKELLWPLDAGEMFFVGKASAQKLRNIGIKTIGDIAASSPDALSALLGKVGRSLWEHANGIDDSPVMHFAHREKIKSVGNGRYSDCRHRPFRYREQPPPQVCDEGERDKSRYKGPGSAGNFASKATLCTYKSQLRFCQGFHGNHTLHVAGGNACASDYHHRHLSG